MAGRPGARRLHYEPWTVHARWEHTVLEKVQGFGGVVLQRGPSLLLVAFGLPHTLEQLPHRAVQTALGIRQMTAEGPAAGEREPRPTVRQAVHWGQVLVDSGARDPTAQVLPIAETLAEPVRLLGQAEPGEILVTASVRRLVEGWFELQACEKPGAGVDRGRPQAPALPTGATRPAAVEPVRGTCAGIRPPRRAPGTGCGGPWARGRDRGGTRRGQVPPAL